MVQIDRLRAMAREAMAQYQMETHAGGEPMYPQWAEDVLSVCESVESEGPKTVHPVRAQHLHLHA